MIVHKDKIVFRNKNMQTEKGRMMQTENENWKKLKEDIEKNGILNPLICTEKNNIYKLCIGSRRFIAGLILGIKEYDIEIVPNDDVLTLKTAIKKYKKVHKNGAPLAI